MGSLISRARLILGAIFYLNRALDVLSKRLKASPGLPVPTPTQSFWTVPKAKTPSDEGNIPNHADIVVIGSGITGASFAYNALTQNGSLRIVILEARDVCSGGTGRNGGHINPPLYHDYKELKDTHGEKVAKTLIKFRLAHLQELLAVSNAEDILKHSQCREVENFDVHLSAESYAEAKDHLEAWKSDMPDEAAQFVADEDSEMIAKYGLSPETVGVIHGNGGAIHPYRFVTSLLSKLLQRYPENFFVATHTPCAAISPPTSENPFYTLDTPKGPLTTPHVVHATNGWCSHLLEPMREKIIPARGTMSAQRPGVSLSKSTLDGLRSFIFYSGGFGYDYLTQLPNGERELMFGGGWASSTNAAFMDIGLSDDSKFSMSVASHLAGALPNYFGHENWGKEKEAAPQDNDDEVKWSVGRTKAQWSGILGLSADGLPWVDRLPTKVSGRAEPPVASTPRDSQDQQLPLKEDSDSVDGSASGGTLTAPPGEWISAGYTGEGMVHAWMSGKALSYMVLDAEDEIQEWFPEILRVTERRWKKADFVKLLERYL